jgi:hypothetical protein
VNVLPWQIPLNVFVLSVFLGFNDPKAKSLTCELQTLAIYAVRRTQQVSLQLYLGFFFVRLEPTESWLPLLLALPESLTSFLDALDGSVLPLSIFPLSLLPWSAAAFPGFELFSGLGLFSGLALFSGFEFFSGFELFSGLELAGLLPLGLLPDDLLSAGLLLTTGFPLEVLPPAGLLLVLAGLPFAGLPFADFSPVGLSPAGLLAPDLPEPCTLSEALAGLLIALDTWAASGLLGGLTALTNLTSLTSCLDEGFAGSTFSVFSVFSVF